MSILLIAEQHNGKLSPAILQLVTAAKQLGQGIDVLLCGSNIANAAQEIKAIAAIQKVYVVDHQALQKPLAEDITPIVLQLAGNYTHILAASTAFGKDIMPRIAALLNIQQISDVVAIHAPNQYSRPIYAGNAMLTLETSDAKQILTVRTTAFAKAEGTGGNAQIETLAFTPQNTQSRVVSVEETTSARPELPAARVVVSGGRALGSSENFKIIEALADKLNAAIGASRAAVDAGYISNDHQVGQTGKVVAPELYIAVGISGAIQHLAGMKESKIIVAINKDENAPIFEVADYGLVADLFDAVPELTSKL
jgi:electron transfer flavoprotein alpha subunit